MNYDRMNELHTKLAKRRVINGEQVAPRLQTRILKHLATRLETSPRSNLNSAKTYEDEETIVTSDATDLSNKTETMHTKIQNENGIQIKCSTRLDEGEEVLIPSNDSLNMEQTEDNDNHHISISTTATTHSKAMFVPFTTTGIDNEDRTSQNYVFDDTTYTVAAPLNQSIQSVNTATSDPPTDADEVQEEAVYDDDNDINNDESETMESSTMLHVRYSSIHDSSGNNGVNNTICLIPREEMHDTNDVDEIPLPSAKAKQQESMSTSNSQLQPQQQLSARQQQQQLSARVLPTITESKSKSGVNCIDSSYHISSPTMDSNNNNSNYNNSNKKDFIKVTVRNDNIISSYNNSNNNSFYDNPSPHAINNNQNQNHKNSNSNNNSMTVITTSTKNGDLKFPAVYTDTLTRTTPLNSISSQQIIPFLNMGDVNNQSTSDGDSTGGTVSYTNNNNSYSSRSSNSSNITNNNSSSSRGSSNNYNNSSNNHNGNANNHNWYNNSSNTNNNSNNSNRLNSIPSSARFNNDNTITITPRFIQTIKIDDDDDDDDEVEEENDDNINNHNSNNYNDHNSSNSTNHNNNNNINNSNNNNNDNNTNHNNNNNNTIDDHLHFNNNTTTSNATTNSNNTANINNSNNTNNKFHYNNKNNNRVSMSARSSNDIRPIKMIPLSARVAANNSRYDDTTTNNISNNNNNNLKQGNSSRYISSPSPSSSSSPAVISTASMVTTSPTNMNNNNNNNNNNDDDDDDDDDEAMETIVLPTLSTKSLSSINHLQLTDEVILFKLELIKKYEQESLLKIQQEEQKSIDRIREIEEKSVVKIKVIETKFQEFILKKKEKLKLKELKMNEKEKYIEEQKKELSSIAYMLAEKHQQILNEKLFLLNEKSTIDMKLQELILLQDSLNQYNSTNHLYNHHSNFDHVNSKR